MTREQSAQALIEHATQWASERDDIRALALIGSYARGTARPDSDVDLVVLTVAPDAYTNVTDWVAIFGVVERVVTEDWGLIQSVRVWYQGGLEVEFGIGSVGWAAIPPPTGTVEVLSGGAVVLLDREGHLSELVELAAAASREEQAERE